MNPIILALGGVRATVFAALATAFLLVAGVQTWRLGNTQDAYAAYQDKVVASTAKAAQAAATAREKAQAAVIEYQSKSAEAERNYQAGRESAIHAQQTIVDDLRNDRIRLRGEWASCMSRRVPAGEATSATASGSDGEASVPAEAFGRVLRVGADADTQVQWLQSELIATRELYSKCMVPKDK